MIRRIGSGATQGVVALSLALVASVPRAVVADERPLLSRRSAYNSIYVTETRDGLRVMRFSPHGPRQSVVKLGDPDHLELSYAKSIPVVLAVVLRPQRAYRR